MHADVYHYFWQYTSDDGLCPNAHVKKVIFFGFTQGEGRLKYTNYSFMLLAKALRDMHCQCSFITYIAIQNMQSTHTYMGNDFFIACEFADIYF